MTLKVRKTKHHKEENRQLNENSLFSGAELREMNRSGLLGAAIKYAAIIAVVILGSGGIAYGVHQLSDASSIATVPSEQPISGSTSPVSSPSLSALQQSQDAAQKALAAGDTAGAQQYLNNANALEQQLKNNGSFDESSFDATEKAIQRLKQQLQSQNSSQTPQVTYTPPVQATPNPQCTSLQNQYNTVMSQESAAISAIQTSNANSNYSMTPTQFANATNAVYAQYNPQLNNIQTQMKQNGC